MPDNEDRLLEHPEYSRFPLNLPGALKVTIPLVTTHERSRPRPRGFKEYFKYSLEIEAPWLELSYSSPEFAHPGYEVRCDH